MDREAVLELHNLTDRPLAVELRLDAVALGGAKRVALDDQTFDFLENRMQEWRLPPRTLAPGLNRLVFRDPLAAGSGSMSFTSTFSVISRIRRYAPPCWRCRSRRHSCVF